jgi:hypothetical protein
LVVWGVLLLVVVVKGRVQQAQEQELEPEQEGAPLQRRRCRHNAAKQAHSSRACKKPRR